MTCNEFIWVKKLEAKIFHPLLHKMYFHQYLYIHHIFNLHLCSVPGKKPCMLQVRSIYKHPGDGEKNVSNVPQVFQLNAPLTGVL